MRLLGVVFKYLWAPTLKTVLVIVLLVSPATLLALDRASASLDLKGGLASEALQHPLQANRVMTNNGGTGRTSALVVMAAPPSPPPQSPTPPPTPTLTPTGTPPPPPPQNPTPPPTPTLTPTGTPPPSPPLSTLTPDPASLASQLLAHAQQNQVIEFNPEGALQKHIFADGFVPNSPEFVLPFEGLTYTGQRAENLVSGAVRIYYAQTGDWANVERIERSNLGGRALEILLLAQGGISQVIEFNPGAALQKRIFADGMVPNSSEFILQVAGVTYSAQRAEHLSTGAVHVYYAQPGDWSNVQFVSRS